MRGMREKAAGLLLFAALLATVIVGAVVVGDAVLVGGTLHPALLVGVLGALLCAWGAASHAALVLPLRGLIPAVTAREHRRALARRAVPRQRDPDAAGHTRSRAPSGLVPAA